MRFRDAGKLAQSGFVLVVGVGLVVCLVVGPTACVSPTLPPPPTPDQGEQSRELEQGHLLLFPSDDSEGLLARPVRVTEDGAWSIGDARGAGCEVSVKREPSSYHVRRRVKLASLTAVSGSFGKLLGIEAGFGSATEADIDIQNTSVLSADTRGDCDQVYVDRVFVGKGRRKLLASAANQAKASLAVTGAPSAGVDASSVVVDETAWDSEQAYAFTYRSAGSDVGLTLNLAMPATVTDGQELSLRIESDQKAFLVVYYRDADGKGQVLWPSQQEAAPVVLPGTPAFLPSERERAAGVRLQATLNDPSLAARETLVVYALRDEADFRRVCPAPGTEFADGAAAAAELTEKIDELPLSRWTRAVQSYVIRPKERSP
jgi:hypothetical protein